MKHWIVHVILLLALGVLVFLFSVQKGFQRECDASASRGIQQLAELLEEGKTNQVCRAITDAHTILSNGFHGMSFEKIVIMSGSNPGESEPDIGQVSSEGAPSDEPSM